MSSETKTTNHHVTIKYNDFDPHRLTFTPLEESKGKYKLLRAFPNYNHQSEGNLSIFFIQLPWIKITDYGLPLKEWFDDKEDTRQFDLKIPLDDTNPSVKDLIALLKKTDDFLSSEDIRTKLFKTKGNKYNYHSIFRDTTDQDTLDNKDKKPPKKPYMVIKIDFEDTDEGKKIKSMLFKSKKIIPDINTLDDLRKHLIYMSEIHPIIRPAKLWAHNGSRRDPMYGLIFKLAKCEIMPQNTSVTKNSIKEYYTADSFIDSDDETKNIQSRAEASESIVLNTIDNTKTTQSSDDESNDSEPESD